MKLVAHCGHSEDGVHHLNVFLILSDLLVLLQEEFRFLFYLLQERLDTLVLLLFELIEQPFNFLVRLCNFGLHLRLVLGVLFLKGFVLFLKSVVLLHDFSTVDAFF